MRIVIAVLVPLLLLANSTCHAQKADKYALLIGITGYEHSRMNDNPLKYPENDANAVAELLKQSGYSVDILLGRDANQAAVRTALAQTGTQGKAGGAVLIGLFGHGVQYGKSAYYCPHDASVRTVKDSRGNVLRNDQGAPRLEPNPDTLISMREILDALTTCGASNRVLLADCCRDDPNRARGRAFGTTLTTKDLPPGTIAMFACSANEQAFEHDDWKHGAFTYAFLKHSREIGTTGAVTSGVLSDRMHATVKTIVDDKTKGASKQTLYWLNSGPVDLLLANVKTPTKSKPMTEKELQMLTHAMAFKPKQKDVIYDQPVDPVGANIRVRRNTQLIDGKVVSGFEAVDDTERVFRRYLDLNSDNKLDTWIYFKSGIEVYRDIDSDFDQNLDRHQYTNGDDVRIGIDDNEDGIIDRWKSK